MELWNTRAFKKEDGTIEITVGSVEKSEKEFQFKDKKLKLVYGEFSQYLKEVVYYLEKAKEYAANDTQKEMIEHYITHFKTGSVDRHKDSQRKWIKDKGPVVETNMGWIETYIDPENVRAYFEGWVSIVDKEKSKKFNNLVSGSEKIIP